MLKRSLIFVLLTISMLGLTGCFDAEVDEQSVPWGRPAEWERGAPGFGG